MRSLPNRMRGFNGLILVTFLVSLGLAAWLAYARQDVVMFTGTLRENVTPWQDTIREADMIRAVHDGQIHDLVAARDAAGKRGLAARAGAVPVQRSSGPATRPPP